MDVNEILGQYKDINQHIDDLNKANKIDFDTKMGTAKGMEFVKGLMSKGKATQEVISGVSSTAKGIVEKQAEAAKAAKASKLIGGSGEGVEMELSTLSKGVKAVGGAAGDAGKALAGAGDTAASALSQVGNVAATGSKLAEVGKSAVGALSKGGAVFGVGLGLYDVGKNIYEDIKNKNVSISGNNWQEKLGTVGEEVSAGLDAAGLALGPEFLLAGALVGGVSEIFNIWGGEKDHEGVPEPPPPVVEQKVTPPNLAQLGMVQNHINNIKQYAT